jgi:hypothetical protein
VLFPALTLAAVATATNFARNGPMNGEQGPGQSKDAQFHAFGAACPEPSAQMCGHELPYPANTAVPHPRNSQRVQQFFPRNA